jgi:thiosulfate reductase cytochrome b subunit
MPDRTKYTVRIYTRYERFWHWSQALLIFFLAFTGFNMHGTINIMDFGQAAMLHTFAAVALLLLWIFTTFWNLTTGNWKQFLPFFDIRSAADNRISSKVALFFARLFAVIRYYAWGILFGEKHPHHKTLRRKQNALQGLAYLTFMVIIGPALWISGIAYLLYDLWNGWERAGFYFQIVVFLHTASAFMMVAFAIIHVYMTTTGKTPLHYIKTMITGDESIELTEVERKYLEQEYPEMMQKAETGGH